ncbi:MAG: hypothetical protein Kow0022_07010 [Phycisphaerales bacterium]
MTPWFDQQMAGIVGGAIGAGVGVVFGAIGGGLGGPLAALGKARTFVLGMFYLAIAVGIGLIGVGVAAIVQDQPWWVWMAFMLPGVISASVMGGLLPLVKGRYRQAEQRKLDAQNFRG